MTRFADPTRCPDCGQPITYSDLACPTCALPLRGDTAARLFQTLTAADGLLASLRAARVPVGAPAAARDATVPAGAASVTVPDPSAVTPPARGLSAASVPKILLTLGAACLLIAALVFLAVTWSVMGVGGRTATLVALTAITAALAGWLAGRDLRGAAEALSVVSLGLLTLDTYGARDAGWLGEISTPSFLVVLGTVLAVAGAAAAVAVRRTPAGGLTGAQVVAGLGVALVCFGVTAHEQIALAVAHVVAVLIAGAAVALAHRLRLPIATALAGLVAAMFWLVQLADAIYATTPATLHSMWVELDAWRLLVAAILVGMVALVRPLPLGARVGAAATAYAVLSLVAVLPALNENATSSGLAALAVLAVAAVVTWSLPRPWRLTGVIAQAVSGLVALVTLASIGVLATTRLVAAGTAQWAGSTGGHLVGGTGLDLPAPWLAPLCVVALIGTVMSLARTSAVARQVVAAATDLPAITAVLLVSGVATLASYDVPVWTVLGVLLLSAAGFLGWWVRSRGVSSLVLGTVFLLGAVGLGWYDEWLTVVSLAVALLLSGLVHLRAAQTDVSAVAGAAAAAVLAGSAWAWGALAGAAEPWVGLTGLALLGALVLTLHLYPGEWWACDGSRAARAGVEVGAAVAALPLGLAGVLLADGSTAASWTAVYLTLAGAAVTALSLLREDRRMLAWAGGALLALASWVRLWDIGVREPEPYTLPTATVLVALGLIHLRRHPSASTMTALAPGLGLALVPSLLWVLTEPTGLRALLLGLGCLAIVFAGLSLRWTAPVAIGAAVGALEVLRLAAPYIGDTVPRWVLIGSAGAVLIAMGVTWERRLRDARQVMGYVRALR